MNSESQLLNAILTKRDISGALASSDIDNLFETHLDIWLDIKKYYMRYRSVPGSQLVEKWHPDFEHEDIDAEVKYCVEELRNYRISTGLEQLAEKIAEALSSGKLSTKQMLDATTKKLTKLTQLNSGVKDINLSQIENNARHYEALKERVSANDGRLGIATGFDAIDASYPTGMAGGHFIVCIGWPGNLKSYFSELLAINVYRKGYKPMIISLEMSPESMRDRIFTLMGSGTWRMSDLSRANIDIEKFNEWSQEELAERDFVIISNEGQGAMTPAVVQAKIDQYRPDFVVIDYLQLMENNGRSGGETERVRAVSRELKMLALQANVPIFAIVSATMTEKADRDNPPMLHHVANSKQIEFDADMAVSVHTYRNGPDDSTTEIACRKNRHGPDFAFYLKMDVETGRVEEVFDI